MRKSFALSILILFLSVVDAITTWYVVDSGAGYETNIAIAWAVENTEFYFLKIVITAVMLYGISYFCNGYEKLEIVSFSSLAIFYSIIVLNNIMVIASGTDLKLNLVKQFAFFGVVFILLNGFIKNKHQTKYRMDHGFYQR